MNRARKVTDWHEISVGDRLDPLAFPLPVYRLIVAAGATRDFNSIHHNPDYAKASGAPDIYANAMFLQGMWERQVRKLIGPAGRIVALRGFRMNRFNCAGDTAIVHGEVSRKWTEDGSGLLEIRLWTMNGDDISVGPGHFIAAMPLAPEA